MTAAVEAEFIQGKTILVTGGTGSIGRSLVREVLQHSPASVRILSRDEYKQYCLARDLNDPRVRFLLGDVRDKDRLSLAMEGADLVMNAAALKQVPHSESNPFEAIKTNVIGTQNIIELAMKSDVQKVVLISTDKVVNPVNTMGTTKLLAEKLMRTAHHWKGKRKTVFTCVRFGNVMGTRGSVLPLFLDQLRRGAPLTVTDPDMTRFIMTMERAVSLVLKAASMATRGEIYIFKMPALRMGDLAEVIAGPYAKMRNLPSSGMEIRGGREGEKMHEQLLFESEKQYCQELEDMLVVGLDKQKRDIAPEVYCSDAVKHLSREEILDLVLQVENSKACEPM